MTKIQRANGMLEGVFALVANFDEKEKETYGERSLTLLAEYPLYVCQSNITYDEAITIGLVLFGSRIYTDENGNLIK